MYTNLQVGRIVAATLVLVFHAAHFGWQVLGTGNLAEWTYWVNTCVIFFFALSGFVLTHSFQKSTLRGFALQRMLRLLPTYWVAIFLVLAVRFAFDPPQYGAMKYVYTLALWPAGPDRLAVFLHVEWSLVYEMFLSMALIPLAAFGRRRGLGIGAGIWLSACLARQIVFPGDQLPRYPLILQIPLSVINVPFLLGVLIYFAPIPPARLRWIILIVSAAALGAGSEYYWTAPNRAYLLQSLSMALLVGFLARGRQLAPKNPLVVAGDWSYGLYLIHSPILLGFLTVISSDCWPDAPYGLVVIAGAVAFAFGCLYGALEHRYFRRLRRWLARKSTAPEVRSPAVTAPPAV